MYYLSKGLSQEGSTELLLNISRGRYTFRLTGTEAGLWQDGRYEIARAGLPDRVAALRHLERMGLVTIMDHYTLDDLYNALNSCVFCTVEARGIRRPVGGRGMRLLCWLRESGLHLTLAELIYLEEKGNQPWAMLLREENRQTLTEQIYDAATIRNGELEKKMLHARCRDVVLEAILELIKTKRIILL